MSKRLRVMLLVSIGVALVIVVVALVVAYMRRPQPTSLAEHPVSKTELTAANGKNGHKCYVAVDGVVYQIIDSAFWQNGQHTPSGGLAYCGADLSAVIDQSPHGRSVLNILPIVGPLQK